MNQAQAVLVYLLPLPGTKLLDFVQEGARQAFEKDGCVLPIAFIEIRKNPMTFDRLPEPQLLLVTSPSGFDGEDSKDMFAQAVRKLAADGESRQVLFVAECWAVEFSAAEKADTEKWIGNLDTHPKRKEMVQLYAETMTTVDGYFAEIVEEDGRKEMQTFKPFPASPTEGRFVRFLRPTAQA